ncbi:MAG: methyltransferase domain-containing protein [Desulfobacterales bacterium]|nr:methyltransferase domain-containing protein [Desulfobacterales bacterium]
MSNDMVRESIRRLVTGCGDSVGLSGMAPGASVVDLGCGAGADTVTAARQVGQQGRVFGIDIDPAMIDRARRAAAAAGLTERSAFRVADIEVTPHPRTYADILISNCVVNLCTDKDQVFRNVFRIMRPGALLVFSVLVNNNDEPEAGLGPEGEYPMLLARMSFTDIRVLARQPLTVEQSATFLGRPTDHPATVVVFTALKPPLNC